MPDTPPSADDIVRAASKAIHGTTHGNLEETAQANATAAAVLRILASDGDTWEADVLEAMAEEIEDQHE